MVWPALGSGRLLEAVSDGCRRGMTVHDRTRLTGQLLFFCYIPSSGLNLTSSQKNLKANNLH